MAGPDDKNWRKIVRNVAVMTTLLVALMIIMPTHHDRTLPFSADGVFQLTTDELIKHYKTSKWSMPPHHLESVSQFFDYVEKPPAACESVVVVGGRACHEYDDHVVCLEQSLDLDHDNCLVYSFGEGSGSFETGMGKLGCNVYTFDPSVSPRTDRRRGDRSWLFGLRLAGNESAALPGDRVLTLDEVGRTLGHRGRQLDYVRLDLDGEEWPVLRRILGSPVVHQVRQLGVQATLEVGTLSPRDRLQRLQEVYQVLVGLEHTGLRLVSARQQGDSCHQLPELEEHRRVCDYIDLLFVRKLATS